MRTILHVTGDFPDAYVARKTPAVRNLLEGTKGFRHIVYSINRRTGFGGVRLIDRAGDVVTLTYGAPAFGVLLEFFLDPVVQWIHEDIRASGTPVDIVHAHKFTIEGLIARRLAKALGNTPFICTVRGNTDQKYLRMKPEKRSTYRKLAREAALLMPVTPWVERYLDRVLGITDVPRVLLPTISAGSLVMPPQSGNGRFITVFHLDSWQLKGMPKLLAALAKLREAGVEIPLDIVGGGSKASEDALKQRIAGAGLDGQVHLVGPVPHSEMQQRMNGYSGFVLPTLRETFGMVFLEALMAGLPILYPADRGIDGFFDNMDVGVRCDPTSVADIAQALRALKDGSVRMKTALAEYQAARDFDRFLGHNVCEHYTTTVTSVLNAQLSQSAPLAATDTLRGAPS
ncbi:MAG: glycosyltransferase [Pseudomonadota bacterium]